MPFQIIRNDLTKVAADAIVNTANPNPVFAGGTDHAVYQAAGAQELLAERRKIGTIQPGEAAVTPAFRLPARYIIHTVGPEWQGGTHGEFDKLASCYRKSLLLARQLNCRSIAFPLISTGVYGFPKEQALRIALDVIGTFLEESEMEVTLVVFDRKAFELSTTLVSGVRQFIDEHYVQSRREEEHPEDELRERQYRRSLFQNRNRYDTGVLPDLSEYDDEIEEAATRREPFAGRNVTSASRPAASRPSSSRPAADTPSESGKRKSAIPAGSASPEKPAKPARSEKEGLLSRIFRGTEKKKTDSSATQYDAWSEPDFAAQPESQPEQLYDAWSEPDFAAQPESQPEPRFEPRGACEPAGFENLSEALKQIGETFQERLLRLIDERELKDSQVYTRANIDRKLFSKIRCNADYTPRKRTVVALAVALELNLDETQDLLRRAGMAFSPSSKFDLIVEYCITHHIFNIYEINVLLFEYEQPLLGS